ncbi:MAG: hypothetical protein GY869_15970 [Planctomycetes bacterium]|nr:hypothetical protein [Planctomycetota bacterium]
MKVQFDISWQNSWRDTENWDAAWIFIKHQGPDGEWRHATLSYNTSDHFAPAGADIALSNDNKGVFIYRNAEGSGTVDWNGVQLMWNYGTDEVSVNDNLQVKVIGIEMVFIPEGEFFVGDGDGATQSTNAFHSTFGDTAVEIVPDVINVVQVASNPNDDDQLELSGIGIEGMLGLDTDNDSFIDNYGFPTGYREFYIMKYEISQEQYKEFLNCLTRDQQQTRTGTDVSGINPIDSYVMSYTPLPVNRNGIRYIGTPANYEDPLTFICDLNNDANPGDNYDGQARASNRLFWEHGM